MAMERWRPFGFLSRQAEVDRLFDSFFGLSTRVSTSERMWAPAVDMRETNNELIVSFDLPGVQEKDINVSMTGDVLTVNGTRRSEDEAPDENYHRLERRYGEFERHIVVPVPVRADQVKATYRGGVLEIRLPKAEPVKPKEIKIDVL